MKGNNERAKLFSEMPVRRAILTLAIPTVISQLITVVYNMADTFFIGQLGDPRQVAAATVAMPCFMFLTAFANLFGLGGSSLISRCLGSGNRERAMRCASFCIWTGAAAALVYGLLVMLAEPVLLPILGASQETWTYCEQYIFWTIGVGAVPTVMNAELAHLIRAEGYSKPAGFGVAFGGILNILLDPLFIFGFKMDIAGAAIATMLSNLIATGYFLLFLYRIRKSTVITPDPRKFTLREKIPVEVLTVGMPGFTMTMMSTVSNTVLNHIVAGYSSATIAGMGIAKKIDLLAYAIAQGMTQGVLPLIGYNYSSGNRPRMKQAIRTALLYSLLVACVGALLLWFLAVPITRGFISNEDTVRYGQSFLRIICLACPSTAINFMVITIFQATGKRLQPLLLSLLRKGSLDVVFVITLNRLVGVDGIAWATPLADWLALLISLALIVPYLKRLNADKAAD